MLNHFPAWFARSSPIRGEAKPSARSELPSVGAVRLFFLPLSSWTALHIRGEKLDKSQGLVHDSSILAGLLYSLTLPFPPRAASCDSLI